MRAKDVDFDASRYARAVSHYDVADALPTWLRRVVRAAAPRRNILNMSIAFRRYEN